MLALARSGEETLKTPETSKSLPCESFGNCAERNGFEGRFNLPELSCLGNRRLVFESQIDSG